MNPLDPISNIPDYHPKESPSPSRFPTPPLFDPSKEVKALDPLRITTSPDNVTTKIVIDTAAKNLGNTTTFNESLALVQKDGMNLKDLNEEMRGNHYIVRAAIEQNGLAIQFASSRLKKNQLFGMIASNQNVEALQFLDKDFIPPISHKQLIDIAKGLGYTSDPSGVCHGVALMGAQAILLNDTESFNTRLRKLFILMKQHKENPTSLFDAIRKDFDILPLFEGIELYQQGVKYPHLFDKDKKSLMQFSPNFISHISELVMPDALRDKGGISIVERTTGIYDLEEMTQYFRSLTDNISFEEPLILLLSSPQHGLSVQYNTQTQRWNYIDANYLETRTIRTDDLAKALFKSFETPTNSQIIMKAAFLVVGNEANSPSLQRSLNSWESSQDFKEIQQATPKKIAFITPGIATSWLSVALGNNDVKTVEALIKAGVDVNQKLPKNICTPLTYAVTMGQVEMVQMLIGMKADVNAPIIQNTSALHLAAQDGNEVILKALLDAGASIDPTDDNGETPLYFALKHKKENIAKILQEKGAKLSKWAQFKLWVEK